MMTALCADLPAEAMKFFFLIKLRSRFAGYTIETVKELGDRSAPYRSAKRLFAVLTSTKVPGYDHAFVRWCVSTEIAVFTQLTNGGADGPPPIFGGQGPTMVSPPSSPVRPRPTLPRTLRHHARVQGPSHREKDRTLTLRLSSRKCTQPPRPARQPQPLRARARHPPRPAGGRPGRGAGG